MTCSWFTGLVNHSLRCPVCNERAYDASLVKWTDSNVYHTGCLLDKLAAREVPAPPVFPVYTFTTGGMAP